jgi:nucleolar protein 15
MAPKSSLKSASKASISNPGKRTSFSTDSPSKPSTGKPKSIPKPVKEPEVASEKSEDEDAEEDDHLYGFSTDEDDSSDDDAAAGDEVDVGKLPTIAKDDATVKRKLDKAKRHPVSTSTSY